MASQMIQASDDKTLADAIKYIEMQIASIRSKGLLDEVESTESGQE